MNDRLIVVVSGPVAGGKSALARTLARRFAGVRLSTREVLMQSKPPGAPSTRLELQALGARLDEETGGAWVADRLSQKIYAAIEAAAREHRQPLVIIDAARIAGQLDGLRRAFGRDVRHVHVTADRATCAERYVERQAREEFQEAASYEEVMQDPTEQQIESLGQIADILIDTARSSREDVLVRAAAGLGLLDCEHAPCVDAVIGGLYGSEGKGNICYHMAPEYDLLVRVGGPNAAHKVPLPSGEAFTHFLLPSGTRNSQADLLLGPGTVFTLDELFDEISRCDIWEKRLSIDPHAMIIEPSDKIKEAELRERIASTASGAGYATARRVLRSKDVRLAGDVDDLEPYIRPASEILEDSYRSRRRIMLEGTQGSGLSLLHGKYPWVTSRDTNVAGCLSESGIAPARLRKIVLVVRSFPIRVGGPSGPLTKEISWEQVDQQAGLPTGTLRKRELTSKTGTLRRVGEFEWDLLRKAALLNSPTDIALTFADYLHPSNGQAWRFNQLDSGTIQFIDELERVCGARVSMISTGFLQYGHRVLIDRRDW
ncbi:MAG TPA: adenylosuccinate synthetase [Solirubrobacteraceae bacterium]|jgi:adenylosuccinate synthase|nr:adenylosuccinate synthetase [Solirubrobacteraceae bacterium]